MGVKMNTVSYCLSDIVKCYVLIYKDCKGKTFTTDYQKTCIVYPVPLTAEYSLILYYQFYNTKKPFRVN